MIWCSADGLREGVVLDGGVVMVAFHASLSVQTVAFGGCVCTNGNHP